MSAHEDQYAGAARIVADMRPKPPCVRGRCAMAKDVAGKSLGKKIDLIVKRICCTRQTCIGRFAI